MKLNDKRLDHARKCGFLDQISNDPSWQDTFIGAYLSRYPNRTALLKNLAEVCGKFNSELQWSDLTDSNLRRLVDRFTDGGVCPSSARTYCAQLKAVMNTYKDDGLFPSKKYEDILTVKGQPSQQVFLTDEEIRAITDYQPSNDNERYVRDVFLIECFTGCRHSDARKITAENIQDGWLTYVSEKTHRESTIPVHRMLPQVISELSELDVTISDAAFNDCIRRICRNCGICEQVKLFQKGKEMIGEKWQFVASHTGRRSIASDLYLHGVDPHGISKILGHSGIAMTERYICSKRELSQEALSFFS